MPTTDKNITVAVPEDRVAEFYAFYARFLAGRGPGRHRGRGPGGRGPGGHGHEHHGHGQGHGRCGSRHEDESAQPAGREREL